MEKVTLKQGIIRGDNRITEITVRKPLTKQLRGTNVVDLMKMSIDEWCVVLPRVTTPKVDKVDFATMPAADLVTLASTALNLMIEDFEEAEEEDEETTTGKND